MRLYKILFFLLTLNNALAAADLLEFCFEKGQSYGTDHSQFINLAECYAEVLKVAPAQNIHHYPQKKLSILAHLNLLFIAQDNAVTLIAGEQSKLKNIQDSVVHLAQKNIIVLDREQAAIYTFPYERTGNVAPIYQIIGKQHNLQFANSITLDANQEHIIVTFNHSKKFYRIKANSDGKKPENKTTPTQIIPQDP